MGGGDALGVNTAHDRPSAADEAARAGCGGALEPEGATFGASRAMQLTNASAIIGAFECGTFNIEWTANEPHTSMSNRSYVLRGSREDVVEYDDSRTSWPFAFIHEEWVVTAVMIEVTTASALRLVGLWGYSVRGDETNFFYLDNDQEDALCFMESFEEEIDGPWNSAFSVSSGDEAVESFECPVLESQTALRKLVGSAVTRAAGGGDVGLSAAAVDAGGAELTKAQADMASEALEAMEAYAEEVAQLRAENHGMQARLAQQNAMITLMSGQMIASAARAKELAAELDSCQTSLQFETELTAQLSSQLKAALLTAQGGAAAQSTSSPQSAGGPTWRQVRASWPRLLGLNRLRTSEEVQRDWEPKFVTKADLERQADLAFHLELAQSAGPPPPPPPPPPASSAAASGTVARTVHRLFDSDSDDDDDHDESWDDDDSLPESPEHVIFAHDRPSAGTSRGGLFDGDEEEGGEGWVDAGWPGAGGIFSSAEVHPGRRSTLFGDDDFSDDSDDEDDSGGFSLGFEAEEEEAGPRMVFPAPPKGVLRVRTPGPELTSLPWMSDSELSSLSFLDEPDAAEGEKGEEDEEDEDGEEASAARPRRPTLLVWADADGGPGPLAEVEVYESPTINLCVPAQSGSMLSAAVSVSIGGCVSAVCLPSAQSTVGTAGQGGSRAERRSRSARRAR